MSCQCDVTTREYAKEGIQLTDEEVREFYEHKTKEDTLFRSTSPEVLGELNFSNEALTSYLKSQNDELAKVLLDSNLFLIKLRKKYHCKDFQIENDMLYPLIKE